MLLKRSAECILWVLNLFLPYEFRCEFKLIQTKDNTIFGLLENFQVHVSTAYCNCDRKVVKEMVYPPSSIGPDQIVSLVNILDEQMVDSLTLQLVGGRPNTYTFTKALAECWLKENKGDLPLVIVRPSIVLSCIYGPLKGWVDNWNGPTGNNKSEEFSNFF